MSVIPQTRYTRAPVPGPIMPPYLVDAVRTVLLGKLCAWQAFRRCRDGFHAGCYGWLRRQIPRQRHTASIAD